MVKIFLYRQDCTAKSYSTLQMVRYRFNIYAGSWVALALWRGDGHRKLVTRFFSVIRRG